MIGRDERRGSGDPGPSGREIEQWTAIKTAASEAILATDGTITHHHAVGKTHRPWFERERGDAFLASLRGLKDAVDPAGIMNPGTLFPSVAGRSK